MAKVKKFLSKIDYNYFLIFLLSLYLIVPLLSNLYFAGHDTGYHIANVLGMANILNLKNILTLKIFPIIAHNFGYGSGIFYPQLPHFLASFILNITGNVFASFKITDFICVFLANSFMYKLLKTVTKDKKLSLVSSLFYMTSAYKIYDYIVRDAMAENFLFVFLPLIFLGVYYLLEKKYYKFYFYFVIGYVGIINSHLVMSIYITIFLGIILLLNFKKIWNKDFIKHFVIATILVILICLPFIIPLLEHKFLGNYVVFLKDAMANPWGTWGNGLSYQFLIGDAKDIGYHFLNLVALGMAIYLVVKIFKEKEKPKDFLLITGLVCTFLGIWGSSILFPWFIMPGFLQLIQFPWRLGIMTDFGLAILSYYAFTRLKRQKLFIILSVISCFIISTFCLFNQSYQEVSVDDYNLSWYGMGWQQEYLPVSALNNYDYLENRDSLVHVVSGEGTTIITLDNTPDLEFVLSDVTSDVTLEIPRLYYLGYNIVADYNGSQEVLKYIESENGFIEIVVPSNATVTVTYKGTKLSRIGNVISLITIIGFIIFMLKGVIENERKS